MSNPKNIEREALSILSAGVSRRRFLGWGAASAVVAWSTTVSAQGAYRVGVGRGSDPYATTVSAIAASGEWPTVAGKVVVVKPNLVADDVPESGKVTDPGVVRAVVDRALADGAALVLIVETAPSGANFVTPGYTLFVGYDPRVHLVDLQDLAATLASNPYGWLYKQVHVAWLLRLPGVVFINVAKLKSHAECTVTLATKNVFGLPDVNSYISPRFSAGRFSMHDRGVHQAIVDLNILRPSDFSIIDGVWGLEGNGPLNGDPVRMDTVLAGRNALAVDRVGMHVMGVAQNAVRYISYLSLFGLGPGGLSDVDVVGDPLSTQPFAIPLLPPELDPPVIQPRSLDPTAGGTASVSTRFYGACVRKTEVVRFHDDRADVDLIRTLSPWAFQAAGIDAASWDGRDEAEDPAPPGRYAIRSTAYDTSLSGWPHAESSWITIL